MTTVDNEYFLCTLNVRYYGSFLNISIFASTTCKIAKPIFKFQTNGVQDLSNISIQEYLVVW